MPPPQTTTLQIANPALGTVDRRPQTAVTPAAQGAPFVRKSRKATMLQFDLTSIAFGATQNPLMKPLGGYARTLSLEVIGTGGSGASVVGTADAPQNILSSIIVRDAFGQPIINLDSYGLWLVDLYSAQVGCYGMSDFTKWDSFSAIAGASGNFTEHFMIPFEIDSAGYCALPLLSAAALPTVQILVNSQANVLGGTVTTAPVFELRAFANFWTAPVDDPSLAPPDVGSSAQWNFVQAPTTWAKSSNTRISLPVQATFIHTLNLVLKDTGASNARVDQFPSSDLTLWVDGVPIHFESLNVRKDQMNIDRAVNATLNSGRPTGVISYTWRDSVTQQADNADTHDYYLYTTPATLIEVGGTSGAGGTGPFAVFAYVGQLFAKTGLPYTHLQQ